MRGETNNNWQVKEKESPSQARHYMKPFEPFSREMLRYKYEAV